MTAAIARRVAELELANAPKTRPVLILTICRAGEDDDLVSVGGVPFKRNPGEPVEDYKSRAVAWAEANHAGDLPIILHCQYRKDTEDGVVTYALSEASADALRRARAAGRTGGVLLVPEVLPLEIWGPLALAQ